MKEIFVVRDNDLINEMLTIIDAFYIQFFKKAILNKYVYKNFEQVIKKTTWDFFFLFNNSFFKIT